YYRAIALLHQLGRDEEAFLLVQQTKGRTLADQSGQAQPERLEKLTSIERAQWRLLQEQAAQLNQQLISEGVQNEPGSKKRFEALGERLKQVEVQRATLADQLTLRYPSLARLRPRTPVASKTLAALLPSDTALVEFLLTEKPLAFVVTKNGLSVYSLPQNIPDLTHQISSLQSACQSTKRETKGHVKALAQGLVAPLAKTLTGKTRLIVCPDGVLWDVPFALLFPQQILSLAHSATLWRRDKAAVLRKPTKEILVYANPDQGSLERFTVLLDRPIKTPDRPIKTPDRGFLSALRTGALSSLPGTEAEAKTISQLFPGAIVRRGSAAQETDFLSEAGSFRTLHLASHAFLNNAVSLLSCLVLASPTSGSSDDGLLTAREILTLELSAELVVLSACSTGQGDTKHGEGVIGLSWAFLVAGAQQLVITQWAVHDEATAQLMATFYAQLKAKKSPAEALHRARWSLQQSAKWRHPHYWAGFSLVGTAT
ncbi:CHAT domain-containing protein, partial [Armatimonas sp.]|uniref:CHAT domain-containing protein n=1 Tax=Armatimonas sp. TaxID=1872638 RepID=UPI003753593C